MSIDQAEKRNRETTREFRIGDALCRATPNLYHFLVKNPQDLRFLKVSQRSEADWLCILAVFAEDGSPMVAFGTGSTFIAAFLNLQATVAGGRWKPDKFAGG